MNVLGVVYPHYSVVIDSEAKFPLHLEVIMSFYYVPHKTFNFELVVAPLDKLKLESQASLFKAIVLHNVSKKDGKECNHLIRMRLLISSFKVLTLGIFKYVKLAKLAMS